MAYKVMKGVYCVDIFIKAVPKVMKGNMMIVKKEVDKVPVVLNDEMKPVDNSFIKKYLNVKNVDDYVISYSISNKKYMSSVNYNI